MAYSNWTITGPGNNYAQLNSTAPWGGLVPPNVAPGVFGNYCRKLEGLSGEQQLLCNLPQTINISPNSTVDTSLTWLAWQGGTDQRFNVSIRTVPSLIFNGTSPFGVRGGGYGIGWWSGYGGPANVFWLDNFSYLSMNLIAGGANSHYMSTRWVVTGYGTYDEIELYQEYDSGGTPLPGGGVWQPVVFNSGFGVPSGVTGVGTTKLTIQDWSDAYARPNTTNGGLTTNTLMYWTGGPGYYTPSSDIYVDKFKIEISNT